MRIVLDTNILARATPGPGSLARELLRRARVSPHVLILSPFLILELARVLGYDRLRRVHGLDDEGIRRHICDLQASALLADPPTDTGRFTVPHDPDDDAVVAAAIEGRADVICTLDRHLLHPDVLQFCAKHNINVLTDVQLMDKLRAEESQG